MPSETLNPGKSTDPKGSSAQGQDRARLKIFLGAAPGVGKTYAMLEAALAKQQEGTDVVVGIVDTHDQPDAEDLLQRLEQLQPRQAEAQAPDELDLIALLARRPQLALVDDLAHPNAPGSRHAVRYQDVQELLDAGIDVFTTVNIQHLESLNDVVTQVTGVRVRETIPDWLIERADEVELIDLSPEALVQRLREGKVNVADQAGPAGEHFFRPGNLSALRELALRRTAERVDDEMLTYMRAHDIAGPWPVSELIMVCVSNSPYSAQLVRVAHRLADRRHVPWLAAFVQTPLHHRLLTFGRDHVTDALRLAEQMGAQVYTIPGTNVAQDVVRFARSHNVTEIIVGKPRGSRWAGVWQGSPVPELIRQSSRINVYVATVEENERAGADVPITGAGRQRANLVPYLLTTLIVAAVGLLAKALGSFFLLPDLSIVFLVSVLIGAVRWGLGPSIYAAVASVLVYDFFFVDPLYTFTIASAQDVLALIVFLVVAVLTSNLTVRIRAQAEAARQRELRTATLYALSQQLARAPDLDSVLEAIGGQVALILGVQVAVLLPQGEELFVRAPGRLPSVLGEPDRAAALWAWQQGQMAGSGTDTHRSSECTYVPLTTARGTVGVLRLQPASPGQWLGSDERRLVEALAGQAAVAVERSNLAQDMAKARVLAETERLRTALLSSVSHDFRTPLASVIGAATSLLEFDGSYDLASRRELQQTILEEAERLDRFVANLLDMTRLESGALQLRRDWVDVKDIVGSALARLERRLGDHKVKVDVAPDLPLVPMDFVLMEQVLVNLLENAAKYSAPDTTIQIRAGQTDGAVTIEVTDEGIGVAAEDLESIFDKFYRVFKGDSHSGGTGLGLSICKGIVEAHGGQIAAQQRRDGPGTTLMVTLPVGGAAEREGVTTDGRTANPGPGSR